MDVVQITDVGIMPSTSLAKHGKGEGFKILVYTNGDLIHKLCLLHSYGSDPAKSVIATLIHSEITSGLPVKGNSSKFWLGKASFIVGDRVELIL